MKPDWKDAPEWANYLAMDESGSWYWYEHEPVLSRHAWVGAGKGRCQYAKKRSTYWEDTKESRPVSPTKENSPC